MTELELAIMEILESSHGRDWKEAKLKALKNNFVSKKAWELIEAALKKNKIVATNKYDLSTKEILKNYANYPQTFLLEIINGIDPKISSEWELLDKIFKQASPWFQFHIINFFTKHKIEYLFLYHKKIYNCQNLKPFSESEFFKKINHFLEKADNKNEKQKIFLNFIYLKYQNLGLELFLNQQLQKELAQILINSFQETLEKTKKIIK